MILFRIAGSLVLALFGAVSAAAQGPIERPASRAPTLQYSRADGCSTVFVYASNSDRSEVFWITGDLRAALNMPAEVKGWSGRTTVNLAATRHEFTAGIDTYSPGKRGIYCSDTHAGWEMTGWRAIAGTLRVDVSEYANCERCVQPDFLVVATLTGAVFRAPDGRIVRAPRPLVIKTRGGRVVGP